MRNKYLINIAFFLSCFPYIAFPPIPFTHVQYPIFLIVIIIFLKDFYVQKCKLNKLEIYFLILGIISLVYINENLSTLDYRFQKRIGIIMAFLIFYSFRRYFHLINVNLFKSVIIINILLFLFQLTYPYLFKIIFENFLSEIKVVTANYRGMTSVTPEPSNFSVISIYYIILGSFFYWNNKISLKFFIITIISSCLFIFFSKSATGYMLLPFALLISMFSLKIKTIYKFNILFIIIFLSFVTIYNSDFLQSMSFNNRALSVIYSFFYEDDLINILYRDESIAHRLVTVFMGYQSLLDGNIFGQGIGSIYLKGHEIFDNNSFLTKHFYERRIYAPNDLSQLSMYIVELGVLFIILIILLFFNIKLNIKNFFTKSVSMLLLIVSFSIVNPIIMILFALNFNSNKSKIL